MAFNCMANVPVLYPGGCATGPMSLCLWELVIFCLGYFNPFSSFSFLVFIIRLAYWKNIGTGGLRSPAQQLAVGQRVFVLFDVLSEKSLSSHIVRVELVCVWDYRIEEIILCLRVNVFDLNFLFIKIPGMVSQRLFNNRWIHFLLLLDRLIFEIQTTIKNHDFLNFTQPAIYEIDILPNTVRNNCKTLSDLTNIFAHLNKHLAWIVFIVESS